MTNLKQTIRKPSRIRSLPLAALAFVSPAAFAHGYGDLAIAVVAGSFLLGGVGLHALVGMFLLAAWKFASGRWLAASLVISALCIAAWAILFSVIAKQAQLSAVLDGGAVVTLETGGNAFLIGGLVITLVVIVAMVVAPIVQYRRAQRRRR